MVERIKIILERCRRANIKVSNSKLEWGKEILFAGYKIGQNGVSPDPEKVVGLKKFPRPQNIAELRSFLGLANHLCHFVPDVAALTVKLRELLRKKNAFVWRPCDQAEFEKLKENMCSDMLVQPFDPALKTVLLTDASRTNGVGFALVQFDKDNMKVIERNSMGLNDAHRNYATIELECLAIQWAVQKCAYYLRGMPHFTCITDHKPLVGVFKKPLQDIENSRLARLREKLVDFSFDVVWKEGKTHLIADALSRAPVSPPQIEGEEVLTHNIEASNPTTCWSTDIAKKDPVYQALVTKWKNGECIQLDKPFSAFAGMWDRISLIDNLLVLDNKRLIVPHAARKEILLALHAPHTGVNKTRTNAREMFFWPGMSNDIAIMTESCTQCQSMLPLQAHEPLASAPCTFPMEEVGIDLFELAGQTWLVMVDNFSGYPFAKQLRGSATTEVVWNSLHDWFLEVGFPTRIRSDNGPQFHDKFHTLCQQNKIHFLPSSAYHAESNGLAEASVKSMKSLLSKCQASGEDFRMALLEWRNCPKLNAPSPAQSFFGRRLKGTILFCLQKWDRMRKVASCRSINMTKELSHCAH